MLIDRRKVHKKVYVAATLCVSRQRTRTCCEKKNFFFLFILVFQVCMISLELCHNSENAHKTAFALPFIFSISREMKSFHPQKLITLLVLLLCRAKNPFFFHPKAQSNMFLQEANETFHRRRGKFVGAGKLVGDQKSQSLI